jgi:hypothetical protein
MIPRANPRTTYEVQDSGDGFCVVERDGAVTSRSKEMASKSDAETEANRSRDI